MPTTARRILIAAAVSVASTAGLATVADAYRGPTKHERAAITRAVKHAKATSNFPDNEYRVTRIKVSTAGPYASGHITGAPGYSGVPTATVIVKRSYGTWKLKTIGTAGVGCGLPGSVQRDLHVDCR